MVDENAIRETLIANLGYYLGKAHELRIRRQDIVDGLKKWTVQALGMATAPHVPENYLARLGVAKGKDYKFGSRPAPYPGSTRNRSTPRWTDRGNEWGRGSRSGGRRSSRDFDEEGSREGDSYRKRTRHFENRRA